MTELSPWQLIATIAAVMSVFLYYMSGFLTLREHNEFVARFNSDIARLEAVEINQNVIFMSKREFKAWKDERDKVISIMEDRLNNQNNRISNIERAGGASPK